MRAASYLVAPHDSVVEYCKFQPEALGLISSNCLLSLSSLLPHSRKCVYVQLGLCTLCFFSGHYATPLCSRIYTLCFHKLSIMLKKSPVNMLIDCQTFSQKKEKKFFG